VNADAVAAEVEGNFSDCASAQRPQLGLSSQRMKDVSFSKGVLPFPKDNNGAQATRKPAGARLSPKITSIGVQLTRAVTKHVYAERVARCSNFR